MADSAAAPAHRAGADFAIGAPVLLAAAYLPGFAAALAVAAGALRRLPPGLLPRSAAAATARSLAPGAGGRIGDGRQMAEDVKRHVRQHARLVETYRHFFQRTKHQR
mmetsp:Transcript_42530/g.121229  ORF Transcript_42530/g.121229 Transcript_42530/m.121229 type:complete len:107 (-) Transcript_42530:112-432(-)